MKYEENMEKYYPYDCKRCGNCCRHIELVEEMKSFDRGDGVCKYLTNDNLCQIYSQRPNICNGQYIYENFYSNISVAEFHEIISNLCEMIRGKDFEKLHQKVSNT